MEKRGLLKEGKMIMKLLQESISFAFSQLRNDKFRTLLSLLGVSVGIFSIVAVLSAVDALKSNMKRGFASFGGDVVSISKWPFSGEDEYGNSDNLAEYRWWEYMRRPSPDVRDYKFIKANSQTASAIAMEIQFEKNLKYGRNSIPGSIVRAVTYDWNRISETDLKIGRYFTEEECVSGKPVGIIGHDVWQQLFAGADPTGKRIKVGNREITVIGLFAKQGESMIDIGGNTDLSVLIPLDAGRYMVNLKWADVSIYARPKAGVAEDDFCDELMMLMRARRRLSPSMKNDFSINKMTFLQEIVKSLLSMVNTVGWVIAGFSLLIGGFGIANIMFVSVKERTNIIGIQKALGAEKYVILAQFLTEAVFLSIAGGLFGILLVCIGVWLIPWSSSFEMDITLRNILSGLAVSLAIGVISGLSPAIFAARLNPVDAINSK